MKKILCVLGTRPEVIKLAPLIRLLKKDKTRFKTQVCVTAQHRQQLDSALRVFDIRPDFDLGIMRPQQDLYDITARVLKGLRPILRKVRPDIVLVQGDTTTAFAAALAAFYEHIPVGHVEAGLRTYCYHAPWPEEINRRLISPLAAFHFAPTPLNKKNLRQEHIPADRIFVTGNTVVDALKQITAQIRRSPAVQADIARQLPFMSRRATGRKLVLVTSHRRENLGRGIDQIARAVKQLSTMYPAVDFVWPVHKNPRIRKTLQQILGACPAANLFLTDSLDYLPFVYLMQKACLVLTDSGGVQEEAPVLGTPVLVMREVTERTEALRAGCSRLVGTTCEKIISEAGALLKNPQKLARMKKTPYLYGDGTASQRIVKILKTWAETI